MAQQIDSRFLNKRYAPNAKAVSYMTKIAPLNAREFKAGSQIHFKIPSNLSNSWIDTTSSLISLTLENQSTTCNVNLSAGGINGLWSKILLSQNGTTISDYNDYGTFFGVQAKMNGDLSLYKGSASVMMGTRPSNNGNAADQVAGLTLNEIGRRGERIAYGNSRQFASCIAHHSSLFNTGKMVTLKGQDMDLHYTIGDFNYSAIWDSADNANLAGLNNGHLVIKDVNLHLCIVQLSDEAQALVEQANDAMVYEAIGVGSFHTTIPANQSSYTVPLGFSYSSLLSLDAVFLPTVKNTGDDPVDPTIDFVNNTYVANNLRSYSLLIDGLIVESPRSIEANPAVLVAYQLINSGSLHRLNNLPLLDGIDAYDAVNNVSEAGSAQLSGKSANILSQELCVYKLTSGNGWSDSQSRKICSGRSTLASTTALQFSYNDQTNVKQTNLAVFAQFRQLIAYNPQTNSFLVSQ